MEIENRYQKFEKLQKNIQDALLAPETADLIYQAGKLVNLSDEKISLLAELVGDVFMDELKESDLINKIKISLEIDDVTAKNLSIKMGEVIKYIRSRSVVQAEEVMEESEEEEVVGIDTKATEEENNPQKEMTPLTTPTLIQAPPAEEKQPTHKTPFILHNEEEIQPTKEAPSQPLSERSMFYKPTFSEEYKKSVLEKEAVSIELGEETEKKQQPGSFKTPIKEVRVVHYSEFRTPLGPFENQEIRGSNQTTPEKEPPSPQSKTSEVHPNNVVDLKDLPLE